jgi:hypothetical protein
MAAAVLAIYYAKFAPFPRLETRFVLPVVPYLLILSGPGLEWALNRYRGTLALVAVLLCYNIVCSVNVGSRFKSDARISGSSWLRANIPARSYVEADPYSTGLAAQYSCCETEMPFLTGRERLFELLFPGNALVLGSNPDRAYVDQLLEWFTPGALELRNPTYVVINSNYFGRFVQAGLRKDLYPSAAVFFCLLLNEQLRYTIVHDASTPAPPLWSYPSSIDFLQNRLVVLKREDQRGLSRVSKCSS